MDAKNRQVDLLIGRSLISAESIAQELRARLVKRLAKSHRTLNTYNLLKLARETLDEFEPLLAQNLMDSELAAWVVGVDTAAKKLPTWALDQLAAENEGFGSPPSHRKIFYPGGDKPMVRFPLIEKAAESLAKRRVLSRDDFDQLSNEAKAQSFTVAKVNSDAALEKIRDTLADLIQTGPTLREFRLRLADAIDTSEIGPGHSELIYRQSICTAYAQGHDTLAQNEIVRSVFPYQSIDPISDTRCRPEHLALASLGLSNTNIYRVADYAFFDLFLPPWSWQCRCGTTLYTIEAAARKGVAEAKRWLETGVEPPVESRLPFIKFRPPPGFGHRPRLAA